MPGRALRLVSGVVVGAKHEPIEDTLRCSSSRRSTRKHENLGIGPVDVELRYIRGARVQHTERKRPSRRVVADSNEEHPSRVIEANGRPLDHGFALQGRAPTGRFVAERGVQSPLLDEAGGRLAPPGSLGFRQPASF